MKGSTISKLVEAMEAIIAEENDDRGGYVYEDLSVDMANAARAVYDACLKGSAYTEQQIK